MRGMLRLLADPRQEPALHLPALPPLARGRKARQGGGGGDAGARGARSTGAGRAPPCGHRTRTWAFRGRCRRCRPWACPACTRRRRCPARHGTPSGVRSEVGRPNAKADASVLPLPKGQAGQADGKAAHVRRGRVRHLVVVLIDLLGRLLDRLARRRAPPEPCPRPRTFSPARQDSRTQGPGEFACLMRLGQTAQHLNQRDTLG